MTTTNLPPQPVTDSAEGTRLFFGNYGIQPTEFKSVDFDAALTFFTSRGFEEDAALNVAGLLLLQARFDNVPIFQILDQLKRLNEAQISNLVGQILNNNRVSTSVLGFKLDTPQTNIARNIAP